MCVCVCVCVCVCACGGGGKEAEGMLIGHRQKINRHYTELQYTIFEGGKRTCRNEEACEMTKFMWQHIQNEVPLKFH